MAELVYALVSGASESNLLGVRVPFRAPHFPLYTKSKNAIIISVSMKTKSMAEMNRS